jgi:hypothetical protein
VRGVTKARHWWAYLAELLLTGDAFIFRDYDWNSTGRAQCTLTWGYSTCSKLKNLLQERDIQGVSRLVDISAGGDFLGLCDQKSSYKHVSDFGRLWSYDRLKLRIEGDDY